MSEFIARQHPGRRRIGRRSAVIAGLTVLALAAAGCAGSGATSANSQASSGAGATAASVGSTLTIADTAFPTTHWTVVVTHAEVASFEVEMHSKGCDAEHEQVVTEDRSGAVP